jgi:hypothetical protein
MRQAKIEATKEGPVYSYERAGRARRECDENGMPFGYVVKAGFEYDCDMASSFDRH